MRLLITGSREWNDRPTLTEALYSVVTEHAAPGEIDWNLTPFVIVHGACPTGADAMADDWAATNWITVERHYADWGRYGKDAGPIRNAKMASTGADLCLAFFQQGAGNRGTSSCAWHARAAGIPVREIWSTTHV